MTFHTSFAVIDCWGLSPRVSVIGYNHAARNREEERDIGDLLENFAQPKDAIRLEGASGGYTPQLGESYGRIGPALERLIDRGIEVRGNDDEVALAAFNESVDGWQDYLSGGFTALAPYLDLRRRIHDHRITRLNQVREKTMSKDLASSTHTAAQVYQIVGSGHLLSGGFFSALRNSGVSYTALLHTTAMPRNGIVNLGNPLMRPNI